MKLIRTLATLVVAACFICGCNEVGDPCRTDKKFSRVAIYTALGYNDLSSDIKRNIQQILDSPLPMETDSRAVVLFVHQSKSDIDFSTPTSPYIIRVTSDWRGNAVCDTLLTMEKNARLTDADVMREGLEFIRDRFESDHYGMIISSHGTGWLPEGYYESANSYNFEWSAQRRIAFPYFRRNTDGPAVKSFGCEAYELNGKTYSQEMSLSELASAIPMHLDYLIFDACLMGCIETAYELKDKCDCMGFSQAEVLTAGFDMSKFTSRFLMGSSADPAGFCKDYYDYYAAQSGTYHSATISLVDCSGLETLAQTCKTLLENYGDVIGNLDATDIQRYFRGNHHWFYDLQDIFLHAGISEAEKEKLQEALDECIIYKNATERVLDDFDVKVYSGFSMYLPCEGGIALNDFYKTLAWNKATGLVD